MKGVLGRDDVKVGDTVRFYTDIKRTGAARYGVVTSVGAKQLTVKSGGRRHSYAYAYKRRYAGGYTGGWATRFYRLDTVDLWARRQPPVTRLQFFSNYQDASVNLASYLKHRDEVIAELDALAAWVVAKPQVAE